MTGFRKQLTDLIRPRLKSPGMDQALVDAIDGILDAAGVPRDDGARRSRPSRPRRPSRLRPRSRLCPRSRRPAAGRG